jgi:conserved oligomeric Golgi complex subunit 4
MTRGACGWAQEEFYVEENVEKAIRIDDYQGDALTTSMVDDVFYILQKCGQRALSSANLQCACAILGQMNNLLASNLRQALDSRWKVCFSPCTLYLFLFFVV